MENNIASQRTCRVEKITEACAPGGTLGATGKPARHDHERTPLPTGQFLEFTVLEAPRPRSRAVHFLILRPSTSLAARNLNLGHLHKSNWGLALFLAQSYTSVQLLGLLFTPFNRSRQVVSDPPLITQTLFTPLTTGSRRCAWLRLKWRTCPLLLARFITPNATSPFTVGRPSISWLAVRKGRRRPSTK